MHFASNINAKLFANLKANVITVKPQPVCSLAFKISIIRALISALDKELLYKDSLYWLRNK